MGLSAYGNPEYCTRSEMASGIVLTIADHALKVESRIVDMCHYKAPLKLLTAKITHLCGLPSTCSELKFKVPLI